jgi:hypothetical protein
MGLVPTKKAEMVVFYTSRNDTWTVNSTALRIAPDDLAQLSTLVDAARTAQVAKATAAGAARSATETFDNAVAQLAAQGASIIATIRGTAKSTGDPNIWVLANLPAPKTPEPVAAPGTPSAPKVGLQVDGSLKLGWACKNPANSAGTIYEVARRVNGGDWEHLGSVGQREYTDAALPAGGVAVTYQVTAIRSTVRGSSAQFNVNFGPGAGGAGTAVRVSEGSPTMRKAA